jgi:hypothetical protein
MDIEHELPAIKRPLWTNDAAIYESSRVEDAVLVFAETGVLRRPLSPSDRWSARAT